ncbi:metal ABC transporter solute-binding protein, Zn/Mn family [Shouchella patagoniensis]|uniref:metal ABC transporter solute-binding protein, Zn/Mn family n=1 Tax=Shouchella patagoniensis TaxID=228576 RepID=UPI00099588AB|nr:zinc ABC transporter substrate-binding protein [Shouchella patagoniensis]
MKSYTFLIASLSSIAFLSACGDSDSNNDTSKEQLTIKTSIFPYEDWTKKIGGDFVHVSTVVPVGADAHTYEPTPQEMIEVAEADAFIYNGANFEAFAASIVSAIKNQDVHILEGATQTSLIDSNHDHGHHGHNDASHDHESNGDVLIEGLSDHYHTGDSVELMIDAEEDTHSNNWSWYTKHGDGEWELTEHEGTNEYTGVVNESHQVKAILHGEEVAQSDVITLTIDDHDGHSHGDEDPHVWLDPIRSIEIAASIRDTLTQLMPEQEAYFIDNFESLEQEFQELDQAFQELADESILDTFIVSHAGYGYWESRYGIKQIGIAGISPTSEPSQSELIKTVELAQDLGLNHVVFEPNITPRVAEVVQNHLDADSLLIHPLEALTEEDKENNADYFSLMYENIETLNIALND